MSGEKVFLLQDAIVVETGRIFGSPEVEPERGCCLHYYVIKMRKGKIIFFGWEFKDISSGMQMKTNANRVLLIASGKDSVKRS